MVKIEKPDAPIEDKDAWEVLEGLKGKKKPETEEEKKIREEGDAEEIEHEVAHDIKKEEEGKKLEEIRKKLDETEYNPEHSLDK